MRYPFIKSLHDLFMVLLSGYEEDYMLTAFVITISMPVHKCCFFCLLCEHACRASYPFRREDPLSSFAMQRAEPCFDNVRISLIIQKLSHTLIRRCHLNGTFL